jgi:hypothetical protein
MLNTLYFTKINENRIWTSPDIKKPKVQKGTKMSEDEFLKYTTIANELKYKK